MSEKRPKLRDRQLAAKFEEIPVLEIDSTRS